MGNPALCQVIVDDAGDVGLRISDAQLTHDLVVQALRKRLGTDAVVYEGAQKNAATMKRMLGAAAETSIQDEQLAFHAAAAKAAPWRVRVRFGTKKGEQWITVACRKSGDDPSKPVVESRFVGKNFLAAKEKLDAGLPGFCPQLAPVDGATTNNANTTGIPIEGQPATPTPVPGLHKKVLKDWSPPPRRD
jgi:hypothetical protein